MGRTFLAVFAGLTIGLGPAAIDSYTAAVGAVQDSLGLSVYEAQLSLSITIFAMGLGQVFCGPLSDRFGRMRPLYAGIFLYLAGSVICYLAPSIEVLIAGRALQGVGASAGQIVARAILRDLYDGVKLANAMSEATAVMSLVVLVSPWMGLWFTRYLGWNGDFVFLALYVLIVLALTRLRLRETNGRRDPDTIKLRILWRSAKTIVLHGQSGTFMLVLVIGTIAMMSYVINAPIVYAESFGITGSKFAALYSVVGIGVFCGQMGNRYLIMRIGTMNSVLLVLGIALGGLTIALGFAALDLLSGYGFAAAIITFATFFMMAVSSATSLVMDPHGKIAGFAASLLGTLSLAGATSSSMQLAPWVAGKATHVLACMVLSLLASFLIAAAWLWRARLRYLEANA